MPVYSNSIKYTNPLDGTPINWLLACVDDPIEIEHNISVKTVAVASTTSPIIINNTDGYFGNDQWNLTGGNFTDFNIGDQISLQNYSSPFPNYGIYTILDKPASDVLILNAQVGTLVGFDTFLPLNDNSSYKLLVSLTKVATAILYQWNFIKNAEGTNFYSKVDGSVQVASVSGLNPAGGGTNIPMTMLGLKPYQVGSITIDEVALTTYLVYSSDYKIKHKTIITPAMLAEQWDDLVAGIAPNYFFNAECLRPVFYFEARYFATDPNLPQTLLLEDSIGNTGWYGELWNGGITNYFIDGLQYYYLGSSGNVSIPSVELSTTRSTRFIFSIKNTVDSPFVAGSTKLLLKFQKAPNDDTEYTANGRDYIHNFVRETALLTVQTSPTAINGDNYSDLAIRSLSNLKATFVSSSEIVITGRFTFNQQSIDVFEESDVPNYILSATIQDHTKQGAYADRVNLLVDATDNFYETSFPSLVNMASKLIPHDCPDYTTAFIDRDKFTEDELVAYTNVEIYEDELRLFGITSLELIKYTAKLLIYNTTTNDEFLIESKSINLPLTSTTQPSIAGQQNFSITQPRPFHVPSTEIRKNILARRNTLLGNIVFEFAFPFLNRWEYWVQLANANSAFFNLSEPLNGSNNDWQHYMGADWKAKYVFELNTKVNGVPATYSDSLLFDILDRNLPSENTTCTIKTYDTDTLTELVDGVGAKYILGYKNTLVKATFLNNIDFFDNTIIGDEPDTTVVLGIEIFEQGSHYGKRRMSSRYVSDSDTWFIPLTGQTKTKLTFTQTGALPILTGKLEAEALIDFNQLTLSNLDYKLTARVSGNSKILPTTGQIIYGNNYLGSQNVKLIPTNPIDEVPIVVTAEQLDCCGDLIWKVLASTTDSDELKNDVNNFIWWFNKDAVSTAILTLVNSAGTSYTLTGSTLYGTPYDYGFQIIPGVTKNGYGESAVGYKIDWRKVLTLLGEDSYYIKCSVTTIFGGATFKVSDSYCLKKYTEARANGTVRAEYYLNGLLGSNENDKKKRDYLSSNWYNQHRFDGVFHFTNSTYKINEVQFTNGKTEPVEFEQEPEFILKLKRIPAFKHNVLRTDILMADEILITDYNSHNIDTYYKKEVKPIGSYDPKFFALRSKLGSIELKFKQKYSNLKKHRS